MSDWHMRLARPGDAAAMPGIAQAVTPLTPAGSSAPSERRRLHPRADTGYRSLVAKRHSLVAHVAGNPIGYLLAEPFRRELHIHELSVVLRHQRRGVGSGLARACLIDARNMSFAALTVVTNCAPFWSRLGFTPVHEPEDHPRLAALISEDIADDGMAADRQPMICFLD